jgi:hypothetical protein
MADAPETPKPAPLDTKELQEALGAIGPLVAEIIKIVKIGKVKGKAAAVAELMKVAVPGTALWTLISQAVEGADEIPGEAKDLDAEELAIVVPILVQQGFIIYRALKTPVV